MATYSWAVEASLVLLSCLILAAYHVRLWRRNQTTPRATAMGRHRLVRAAWADMIRDGAHDLLAVQTIRNWIMSASFLASSAVLIALGLIGATFTTDKLSKFAHELNFLGSQDTRLWLLKSLFVILLFFASFLNFTLSIRAFIHAGFAFNIVDDGRETGMRDWARQELEKGASHFTLGMRGFYFSIPLCLWLFGPLWMLSGAVVLTVILSRID